MLQISAPGPGLGLKLGYKPSKNEIAMRLRIIDHRSHGHTSLLQTRILTVLYSAANSRRRGFVQL